MSRRATSFEVFGLSLYAASTLISMAIMNLGFGVYLLSLIFGLGGIFPLFHAIRKELHQKYLRFYLFASLALGAVIIGSLLAAWLWPLGYGEYFVQVHFFQDIAKLWYLILPLLLLISLKRLDSNQRTVVIRTWLGTFGILSLVGIFQYFYGWPRPQVIPDHIPERFHATLGLGHHLSVASIFIFPFFAGLEIFRKSFLKKKWKVFSPLLLVLILTLGFITLFLTYSRTLWVALPVGILVWILLTLAPFYRNRALALVAVLAIFASQVPAIQDRVQAKMGVGPRVTLWKANLEFLKERPLLGVGWRKNHELSGHYLLHRNPTHTWVFSGHAHNNFIDMLGGTGILGTLIWIFWWGVILTLVWKGRHHGSFAMGLVCAFLVFHINGLTQVNGWEGKVQHQMMFALGWAMFFLPSSRLRGKQ